MIGENSDNTLPAEDSRCKLTSLLLKYTNEASQPDKTEKKAQTISPEVCGKQNGRVSPQPNGPENDGEFLWNIPKEMRKEVLRQRMPYSEFVRIFGKEYKKIKFEARTDLKITIPNPFTFQESSKENKKFYEYFLEQTLIDLEESKKPPEFKPFVAKKIPRGLLEPKFEQQKLEDQQRKQEWKEKREVIRRAKN